jgi:hypothetical protein
MKNIAVIAFFLVFFHLISCAQTPKNNMNKKCLAVVKKKIGENFSENKSEDGNFTLYFSQTQGTAQQPQTMLYYVVLKNKDCALVKEGEIFNGKIYWINAKTLEYYTIPGMMKRDENLDDLKKQIVIE